MLYSLLTKTFYYCIIYLRKRFLIGFLIVLNYINFRGKDE